MVLGMLGCCLAMVAVQFSSFATPFCLYMGQLPWPLPTPSPCWPYQVGRWPGLQQLLANDPYMFAPSVMGVASWGNIISIFYNHAQ